MSEVNPVENNLEGVQDDAVLKPLEEETPEVSSIEEIASEPQQETPPKEPGWIRQRIDKAVSKAVQETEARMQAQFERTLAPLRESMYERQADELVAAGEFKTRERALEYVKLKNGNVESPQPRDEQGRFTTQEDPAARTRAQMLASQARKIKSRGVDVMQEFNSNPETRQKVLSGEWDFYDVAESMTPQRRTVAPVRSANGGGPAGISIANMTDAQFKKLQDNLAAGKIYDAR